MEEKEIGERARWKHAGEKRVGKSKRGEEGKERGKEERRKHSGRQSVAGSSGAMLIWLGWWAAVVGAPRSTSVRRSSAREARDDLDRAWQVTGSCSLLHSGVATDRVFTVGISCVIRFKESVLYHWSIFISQFDDSRIFVDRDEVEILFSKDSILIIRVIERIFKQLWWDWDFGEKIVKIFEYLIQLGIDSIDKISCKRIYITIRRRIGILQLFNCYFMYFLNVWLLRIFYFPFYLYRYTRGRESMENEKFSIETLNINKGQGARYSFYREWLAR